MSSPASPSAKPNGQEPPPRLPLPNIFRIEYLFERISAKLPSKGFRRGSSLLVTGRPGSGKTFFALSLVREQMRSLVCEWVRSNREEKLKSPDTPEPSPRHWTLLYCGVDVTEEKLVQDHVEFDWFRRGGSFGADCGDEAAQEKNRVKMTYRVLNVPETEMPLPSIGAEELIQPLLLKIRDAMAARPDDEYIVVIDNVSALLKGSRLSGERQRQAHELHSRIRRTLGTRKQMCVFISDEPEEGAQTGEKESDADFVLHLGYEPLPGGLRRRTLEVRKCPAHTPLVRGPHSWAMVTNGSSKGVIASEELRDEIAAARQPQDSSRHKHYFDPKPYGVVCIFPAYQLPAIGYFQDKKWRPKPKFNKTVDTDFHLSTGIPGLDEMISGDREYWASPTEVLMSHSNGGTLAKSLHAGSTNLLVGSAGSGKSNCCLAFLFQNRESSRSLYVNFENRPHRAYDLFPGPLEVPKDGAGNPDLSRQPRDCLRLFYRRAEFDLNVFVNELAWLVESKRINRVAFDGLSDLASILESSEYELLVEMLVISVRQSNFEAMLKDIRSREIQDSNRMGPHLVTIYITLEQDAERPTLRESAADSPADNVIVFRQVKINNERRKTVEVRKARGQAPDKQVRELIIHAGERSPMRIVPSLDNYRGLGDGNPEPVRVALQLISYNHMAEAANQRLAVRLHAMFGYEVRYFGFTRAEVVRTLSDIASGMNRIPMAEVKLLNVDEWWVRELRVSARRAPGRTLAQTPHPLLRLNRFLQLPSLPGDPDKTAYHPLEADFWAIEMEKCCVPVVVDRKEDEPKVDAKAGVAAKDGRSLDTHFRADVVGLPSFSNYGVFCINKVVARQLNLKDLKWRDWLNKLPRVWAFRERNWFRKPAANKLKSDTMVDFMRRALGSARSDGLKGFSFDLEHPVTASCAFMEFCWAFGAGDNIFISDVAEYYDAGKDDTARSEYLRSHPVTWAMKFLMFLVAEGFMEPRPSLRDARQTLFSRVWFLGLSEIDPAARPRIPDNAPILVADSPLEMADESSGDYEKRAQAMQLLPLPFFPCGAFEKAKANAVPTAFRLAFQDTLFRFNNVLQRIEVAMDYRRALIAAGDAAIDEKIADDLHAVRCWRGLLTQKYRAGEWSCAAGEHGIANSGELQGYIGELLLVCDAVGDMAAKSRCFEYGRGYERKGPVPAGDVYSIYEPNYPYAPDRSHVAAHFKSMAGKDKEGHAVQPEAEAWRHLPYAMFMDVRDILELMEWQRFRLKSLRASLYGMPFGDFLNGEPICPTGRLMPFDKLDAPSALSGYTCEGTWIVAADRTTQSPGLSAKLLSEMTSTAMTTERGKLAAGIPVRKDFYEEHGDETVPCVPEKELTWRRLLKYVGSRSYRRGRTFCARVRVTLAYEEMVSHLHQCLTLASHMRKREKYQDERENTIRQFNESAEEAVARLFEWFRDEMRHMGTRELESIRIEKGDKRTPELTCVTCPHADKCHVLLTDPSPKKGNPA